MTPDFDLEELKTKDFASAHSIISAGGGGLPKAQWITEIKKWKQSDNGLARGMKVVRNLSGYIVACISYKVKVCKNGNKCLFISGILIPNMFEQCILKRLGTVFEELMENENCNHIVIGYEELTKTEKNLFGNQLENLVGKIDTSSLNNKLQDRRCPNS